MVPYSSKRCREGHEGNLKEGIPQKGGRKVARKREGGGKGPLTIITPQSHPAHPPPPKQSTSSSNLNFNREREKRLKGKGGSEGKRKKELFSNQKKKGT